MVLAFHKVQPGFSWGITNYQPRRFRRLLNSLYGNSQRSAVSRSVNQDKGGREQDPSSSSISPTTSSTVLTFDDGYASFLEYAYPVLVDLGLSATLFLPTAYIGRNNTWDYSAIAQPCRHLDFAELATLSRAGFSIQSHTHSHTDLTRLTDLELSVELRKSKSALEEKLGVAVTEICYPFGRYNQRVEEAAQQAGYLRGWSLNPKDRGPFTYGRWSVYAFDTPLSLSLARNGGIFSEVEIAKRRCANYLARAGSLAFWRD